MRVELKDISVNPIVEPFVGLSMEEVSHQLELSADRMSRYQTALEGLHNTLATLEANPSPNPDAVPFILIGLESLFSNTDVDPIRDVVPGLESYSGGAISTESIKATIGLLTTSMEAEGKQADELAVKSLNLMSKKARVLDERIQNMKARVANATDISTTVSVPDSYAALGAEAQTMRTIKDLKDLLKKDIAKNATVFEVCQILTDIFTETSTSIKKETMNLKIGYDKLVKLLHRALSEHYPKIASKNINGMRLLGNAVVESDIEAHLHSARSLSAKEGLLELSKASIELNVPKSSAEVTRELSGVTQKELNELLSLVQEYQAGVDRLGPLLAGKFWTKMRNSLNYFTLNMLLLLGNPLGMISSAFWFGIANLVSDNYRGYMRTVVAINSYSHRFIAPALRRQQKVAGAVLDLIEKAT